MTEQSKIENDMLIREVQYGSYDNTTTIKRQCVMSKEEFLLCYNTWIKGDKQ